MGNSRIHTPRIDQMAAEGIRFTQALAGAPVCAPLRCTLMTGKHMGHASVRVNDGGTPLRAGEATLASMLKKAGYVTGGFGKWGCGGRDSTGVPEKHGFDVFLGYYDQVHAHSFYPPYLIRNSEEMELAGNRGGRSGQTYSHYVIMDEGLQFIKANRDRPFFCYLPITPPHGMYDIPEDDPAWELYRDDLWVRDPAVPQDAKNYAAMVTMVDRNVGQVLDLLRELKLEDKYLNLPVTYDEDDRTRIEILIDGKGQFFLSPNLADSEPDFWVFLDVAAYKGKTALIKTNRDDKAGALQKIYQSDEREYLKNVYKEVHRPQLHSPQLRLALRRS